MTPSDHQNNDGTWRHLLRDEPFSAAEKMRTNGAGPHIVATYDYQDEDRSLLMQVVRLSPKSFRQRRPGPNGEWEWKLGDVKRVPYRLPELLATEAGVTVYVVEGEKDADRLASFGLAVTTTLGGARNFKQTRTAMQRYLAGRDVIVVQDRDDEGRAYGQSVAEGLKGAAKSVYCVELPEHKDASAFFEAGGDIEEFLRLTTPVKPDRALCEVFLGPATVGERLATGLPSLDRSMRGGFPVPRFVVVGGAPGAGKTTIVAQWAVQFAKAGRPVFCFAIDEGAEGLGFRCAQQLGCDFNRLDDGDEAERRRANDALKGLPIRVMETGFLDDAVAYWKPPPGAVLICDSLQTISTKRGHDTEHDRSRVEWNTRTVKQLGAKHKLLTVVTSEIGRAFYRNRETARELNPLAAFKESGGIEFAAETALVLTTVPDKVEGDGQVVDVDVAKNRRYEKVPWRMVLDRPTATFREVPRPDDEDDSAVREVHKHERLEKKLKYLLATGNHPSFLSLWKASKSNRSDVFRVLRALETAKQITRVGEFWRPSEGF